MLLTARSPLPTTTSCSYSTSNDRGTSNSTTSCDDISDGGIVVLTLCIIGPFVLIVVIFLGFLLLQWIRPRLPGNGPITRRGRHHDGPKPGSDSDSATLEKIDFDDDGSATCVSVTNPTPGEVDIPSSLSYHNPQQQPQSNHSAIMPFLRKGLFRAASSSSSSSSSYPPDSQGGAPPVYSSQAAQPASQSTTQHADPGGMDVHAHAGAGNDMGTVGGSNPAQPTFQRAAPPTIASRLRSFSESTITLSSCTDDFYSAPGSRAPTTSLPSSPSIPPPPTGTVSGTVSGSGTGTGTGTGNAGTPSTFSLSLSEKLERLNQQMMTMQKKTSSSSLRLGRTGLLLASSPAPVGCGTTDEGDTSMEFKCAGLPESGTFSVLTELEAAMRVEDELATIERLSGRM